MEYISIIVPIYHGKKYIRGLICQIEDCTVRGAENYKLELVLVNDDPECPLDSYCSDKLEIRIIETDQNRGIHASRVRGLNHCCGDFVLLLDQDDRIEPEYFASQLKHIGDADAVVCKLLHEGKQFYDTRMPFEQVITKEYIISVRNSIISPGQVLIRKSKIPETWKAVELKNNGADDWLLWVCMMAENRKFSLNQETLFEHVFEGQNESVNAKHMIESEQELYRVVEENKILTGRELAVLHTAVQNAAADHIKVLSKFQKMFFVYNTWMVLYEQGICIEDYLAANNVRSIAVYGFSYIGKRLYFAMSKGKVCVEYFIDMNAGYLEGPVPIYPPDAHLPLVDMVIISLVDDVDSISKSLSGVLSTRICGITQILEEMKSHITGGTL